MIPHPLEDVAERVLQTDVSLQLFNLVGDAAKADSDELYLANEITRYDALASSTTGEASWFKEP